MTSMVPGTAMGLGGLGVGPGSQSRADGNLTRTVYGLIKDGKYSEVVHMLEPYYQVRVPGRRLPFGPGGTRGV